MRSVRDGDISRGCVGSREVRGSYFALNGVCGGSPGSAVLCRGFKKYCSNY